MKGLTLATKLHNQMTGADLHPNAIDGTTGTELTPASQTIYDGRWLRTIGGTVSGTVNITGGLNYGGSPLNIELTRTLPTTLNNYVEIGNFTTTNATHILRVSVSVDSANFSVAKFYVIVIMYGFLNAWMKYTPLSTTGPYASNDFDLDVNASGSTTYLRVRRSGGGTAGTTTVRLESTGVSSDVFIPTSATASTTAPTQTAGITPSSPITPSPKTAAYTAAMWDSTITADATSATFQVTLPSAVPIAGRQFTIKRTNSGANNVTVGTTSSQLIDGAATKALGAQYSSLTVQSDGVGWQMIAVVGTVT